MYPEQYDYISSVISLLAQRGHCLLEMPSGTGKTISLLSATISYLLHIKHTKSAKPFKIMYCSRTVSEIEKALIELKKLMAYIQTYFPTVVEFLGLGLTAKRSLCINEDVRHKPYGIDHACNKLLARADKDCEYYLGLDSMQSIPYGVYSIHDMVKLGRCSTACPYYLSRKFLGTADCIIFTYNYVIDPRIKSIVLKEIGPNSIVIFDEAHNIDNACIEAMSVEIKKADLEQAGKELKLLEAELNRAKKENESILLNEYENIKKITIKEQEGAIMYNVNYSLFDKATSKDIKNCSKNKQENIKLNNDEIISKKIKSEKNLEENNINENRDEIKNNQSILNTKNRNNKIISDKNTNTNQYYENNQPFFNLNYEFAPGNIRNAVHFLSVLKRILEFFKTKLKTTHLTTETTSSFCNSIKELTLIDKKTLTFLSSRFNVLIRTLKVIETDYVNVKSLCEFGTLCAQFKTGFSVIFEPFDTQAPTVFSPILRLYCLDASIALKGVFLYRNVIITSGTLSPLGIYAKLLDFIPVMSKEIKIQLDKNCIGPLIVTKGNDQMIMKVGDDKVEYNIVFNEEKENNLSSSYSLRNDPSVIRNYANLIIEFSKIVPDGMVVFFPSYIFMEEILSVWCEINLMSEIIKNKLIFIETPDIGETDKALFNFQTACSNGRGAILFSVARGKVSEGIDFKNEHGRCVIVLGVPYQYTESVRLKKRLEYLNVNYNLKSNEFLAFDAMRQAAQCLGRVIRGKDDYGLMVMADYRFDRNDKKSKLPKWILDCLEPGNTNLSVDMAICIAKRFYRDMGQNNILH